MGKFTIHNSNGDFMHDTTKTLDRAKEKCHKVNYKCKVYETYYARSPWRPWDEKLVEHGKEVYRNY